jgi:hypothetical protein
LARHDRILLGLSYIELFVLDYEGCDISVYEYDGEAPPRRIRHAQYGYYDDSESAYKWDDVNTGSSKVQEAPVASAASREVVGPQRGK